VALGWTKATLAPPAPILGSDRDAGAIAAAARNAARAELADHVTLECRPLEPRAWAGLVVCNPPFGKRIAGSPAAALRSLAGARLAVLTPDASLPRALRRQAHGLGGVVGRRRHEEHAVAHERHA